MGAVILYTEDLTMETLQAIADEIAQYSHKPQYAQDLRILENEIEERRNRQAHHAAQRSA